VYFIDPIDIRQYREPIDKGRWDRAAWGDYRVRLKPALGTDTLGRSGLFLHGGERPGTAGCISIGNQDSVLIPKLRGLGRIRLTVK
jgi:hypothetical protein